MASTSFSEDQPHIILIPGYWLGSWAWDEVIEELNLAGTVATALTLPGLDPQDLHRTTRTLQDQAAAIVDVLRDSSSRAVVVAHSGANGPVSLVLDKHPKLVSRVIWVDSGPVPSGGAFDPDIPTTVSELPLPDFDILSQQASLDGLDEQHLVRFRSLAVPEPARVARASVELTNAARHDVPTTLICCSVPSSQVLELAERGHPMFSDVALLSQVNVVDLPTGHWPMWSRPKELADALRIAAGLST